MYSIHSLYRAIDKTSAIVFDGDGTLWKGRWLEGLGYRYMKRSIETHNYIKAVKGAVGAIRLRRLLREHQASDTAETEGLMLFYDILVKNGLGERYYMANYAEWYMEKNRIWQTVDIVNLPCKFKIIATLGGSTGADSARALFGLDESVSNIDIFDKNKLKGIKIVMADGEDKVRETWNKLCTYGIRLSDCTVIGDCIADIPMLVEGKVRIASPEARPEVLAIPGIINLKESLLHVSVA